MDLNKRQSFDSAQSASTIITAEVTTPPRGNPITRSQTLVIQNSFTFIETAGSLSLITPVALPTASNSNSVSQTSVSTVASAANTTQSANSIATPSAVASTIYGSAPLGCPTGLTTASQCYYDASGSAIAVHPTTVTTTTSVAGASASPVVFVSYVPFAALDSTNVSQTSSSASTSRGSSASNTATTRPAASSGISTAALAGAAVGCLILGALIAGLIAFFILKKRSRSRDRYVSRDTYVPTASPAYGGEKGTPMVSIASVPNMDFLPQQADDAEVKRKLSTVLDQIDQHVENFYGNRAASMSPNWEAEISRFETNELSLPLAACFQNSNVPMTLIKHCLAYHVFNLTMSPGEHGTPLLPPEMAGMVAAMYHKSLSTAATKDNITAFSTWKSLTRYLRPDLGRDQMTAKNTSESSARIATHFTSVFSSWAHTQYNGDTRARHLTEVINQAVQTAIWLFGQPDNFKYEWDLPNTRQDTNYSAVVAPAVWKTTHGGTRLNGKGQNVIPPVIKGF